AVAGTLRLDRFERAHLFTLAAVPDPDVRVPAERVPASLHAVLAQLEPFPAMVLTTRYDILAWNRAHAALVGDVGALPPERRNLLWLFFSEPSWRELLLDWERDVRYVLASFRGNMATHVGEPAWTSLVAELEAASPEFCELWARHEVSGPRHKRKR